jgi:hypothetical protein
MIQKEDKVRGLPLPDFSNQDNVAISITIMRNSMEFLQKNLK